VTLNLAGLRDAWRVRWPEALGLWSPYARLSEPVWCMSSDEAAREHLTMSFAMIRLTDHAVVLNLKEIADKGLNGFPLEVMGHEIGHHIYCPGDLADQGRLLARVRRGLPGVEKFAPLIANLYADLFINDRLQRNHGLHLDQIYARLGSPGSVLWRLYLRIYELLWRLDNGTLSKEPLTDGQEGDAQLAARLVRVYARDWLKGATSFAALCLPYLNEQEGNALANAARGLLDSGANGGDAVPDGLSELDPDESEPVRHPAYDPAITGEGVEESGTGEVSAGRDAASPEEAGGRETLQRYRDISEYRALVEQLSPGARVEDVTVRYYRERAQPYLIRFPERKTPVAQDPIPEGLETWDIGRPLTEIDWVESVTRSAHVVPGLTTLARVYGETPGQDPKREPLDLYVGIDCSGSMPNPRMSLSYPVLAGFIVALSALRAGVRVMACLSGEPGRSIQTEGFLRDRDPVLKLLTDYLGMGYSYGIFRLDDMVEVLALPRRPVHILILTDTDIFSSLAEQGRAPNPPDAGWTIAERALREAGGGGTMLLHVPGRTEARLRPFKRDIERLEKQGWRIAYVAQWEDILDFARKFAADLWENK
jgi:hypothetical protein